MQADATYTFATVDYYAFLQLDGVRWNCRWYETDALYHMVAAVATGSTRQ